MLPKKIKINGLNYSVNVQDALKYTPKELQKKSELWLGAVNLTTQKIFLHSALTKEGRKKILLHEILEVIDKDFELKLPHKVISTLESSLYQVIKDNKLKF